MDALDARRAWKAALLIAAVSTAVRVANVVAYYGFASGDDVEIHQMTFGVLFGRTAPVWDIRSPFFPMAFVYPVQRLLVASGATDPGALVAAGRLGVAAIATAAIVLLFRVAAPRLGLGGALLAALFLATSRLHLRFGAAELPGPLSAALLVGAFGLLARRGAASAAAAGLLVGTAAALRFSEAVFVAPLVLHLLLERRGRDLLAALATCALAMAVILGPVDALYWNEPFHSLRAQVDFTLVQGRSSSGADPYQPWHHYATDAPRWTNVFLLALFAASVTRDWRIAVWALVPILGLSVLPHKEERYLVPALPFLALGAAAGFCDLLRRRAATSPRSALVLFYVLAGALLLGVEGFRYRRSEGAVDVARWLAAHDPAAGLAVEQAWRAGSDLYLPGARIVDLDGDRLGERAYAWGAIRSSGAAYVALRAPTVDRHRLEPLLATAGFTRVPLEDRGSADPYRLYRRGPAPP
jgi:glycosyl transferase family 22 (putative mannosyltransferase)